MNNSELLPQKNLSHEEKKNLFLAVACGCLTGVNQQIPGPDHQKKKRLCAALRGSLMAEVAPRLQGVKKHNLGLLTDTIKASEVVLMELIREGRQITHVLLNLAAFCIEELPVKAKHREKLTQLFSLWQDAYAYEDVRSGDQIFMRIEAEVQILVAQRGGILL